MVIWKKLKELISGHDQSLSLDQLLDNFETIWRISHVNDGKWVIDAAAIQFWISESSNKMPKDGKMKGINELNLAHDQSQEDLLDQLLDHYWDYRKDLS